MLCAVCVCVVCSCVSLGRATGLMWVGLAWVFGFGLGAFGFVGLFWGWCLFVGCGCGGCVHDVGVVVVLVFGENV